MEVQTHFELDRSQVTCPHCHKQYAVMARDLKDELNRFVCKQCERDFWVRSSTSSRLSSEFAVGSTKEKCPKCGHIVRSLTEECTACGVVGAKYLSLRSNTPYLKVGENLSQLWRRVLNHYDDDRVHHEFLSQCLKEKQLKYASLQYKQLKETLGPDTMSTQMLRKIQSLSQMNFENQAENTKKIPPGYIKYLRWEILSFGVGLICIFAGLASPMAKNLISLGVVFCAFPLLLRMFFKK